MKGIRVNIIKDKRDMKGRDRDRKKHGKISLMNKVENLSDYINLILFSFHF